MQSASRRLIDDRSRAGRETQYLAVGYDGGLTDATAGGELCMSPQMTHLVMHGNHKGGLQPLIDHCELALAWMAGGVHQSLIGRNDIDALSGELVQNGANS